MKTLDHIGTLDEDEDSTWGLAGSSYWGKETSSYSSPNKEDRIWSPCENGELATSPPGHLTAKRPPKRQTLKMVTYSPGMAAVLMSVLARKHPNCISDLMGYQSLIIDALLEFEGDSWAGYNCHFHQQEASNPQTSWSLIDPILWSLAFT